MILIMDITYNINGLGAVSKTNGAICYLYAEDNMKKLNDNEIHEQLMKEIKATFILIAIVAVWHVGFAFLLDGIDMMIFGMPLWFFVSTIGAFIISVAGVVFLLKKIFLNFELGEEVQEKFEQVIYEKLEEVETSTQVLNLEGGEEA